LRPFQALEAMLKANQIDEARRPTLLELHQEVDVAPVAEVVPEHRAERRQLGDTVLGAQERQRLAVDLQPLETLHPGPPGRSSAECPAPSSGRTSAPWAAGAPGGPWGSLWRRRP
jgi:hypothetical protein